MHWKDRKFRILYLPENQSEMREYILSRNRIWFFSGVLIAILFIMMSVIGIVFSEYSRDERLSALRNENKVLKQQLAHMETRIVNAEEQLHGLHRKDSELRLVSNLPDVEQILRDAGVGGSVSEFSYNPDLLSSDAEVLIESNLKNLDKLETAINLEMQSYATLNAQIQSNLQRLNYIPSVSPMRTGRITDRFGTRRGFRGWKSHTGLDIASRWGTPVYATADGTVESTAWRSGYGKSIIINHGNGFKTLYGHLSAYSVRRGQTVKRNQAIGKVGSTGLSTGPHLHYEVRYNDIVQNPELYIFFDMVDQLVIR